MLKTLDQDVTNRHIWPQFIFISFREQRSSSPSCGTWTLGRCLTWRREGPEKGKILGLSSPFFSSSLKSSTDPSSSSTSSSSFQILSSCPGFREASVSAALLCASCRLELYAKVPNLRILACGGDGTVSPTLFTTNTTTADLSINLR